MLVQAAYYTEGTFIRESERGFMTIVADIDVGSRMKIRG